MKYAIRWWYIFCAWYLWHVAASVQRQRMKLEADVSHRRKRQRILHTQQAERLEMNMRHERELLLSRQQQLADYAGLMEAFTQPTTKVFTTELREQEIVDHEILGTHPEDLHPLH